MLRSDLQQPWFWVVQCVSIARVVFVFVFVILCPFPKWWPIAAAFYLCAGVTDWVDGRLARAKNLTTHFGAALDVFGDRYFSIVSCVYLGFRGVSLIPLAIIIARELYSVALRMVQVEGKSVMMQNRIMGGVVHVMIAMGTFGFISSPNRSPNLWFFVPFYAIATIYVFYLPYSIVKSREGLWKSIKADLDNEL